MNKKQMKHLENTLGKFTPYFSTLNTKNQIFLDSDISGTNDLNRSVIILNNESLNINDSLIKFSGFETIEGHEFSGKIYLYNDNFEVLIAEPCYSLTNTKVKFSTTDLKSYVQEIWLQSFNEYKLIEHKPLENRKSESFNLPFNISEKKHLVLSLGILGVLSLVGGSYLLGSKVSHPENNPIAQQSNTNTVNTLDGKTLALQNLGLDPNSIEFDNSCFAE